MKNSNSRKMIFDKQKKRLRTKRVDNNTQSDAFLILEVSPKGLA